MQFATNNRTSEAYDTPEVPDALRLWRHIFGDRPDLIQIFTGNRKTREKKCKLSMVSERYYAPDQLGEALAWATQQSSIDRDAYFSVHQLTAPARVKENAASVCALWCETDGVDLGASPIKPTAVVESSPGHFHCYARLTHSIAPHVAEALNKRWAKSFGADGSGYDLTQLLRVPGTRNYGYANAPEVRLLEIDEQTVYDSDKLDRILPKLPERMASSQSVNTAALSEDDSELIGKLGRVSPVAGRLYAGDTSDYADEHGNVDPSDADWGLAQDLVRACGGDLDRAERLAWQSGLAREKWNDRRGDVSMIRYTLQRAAQNATPYRSADPQTWPELAARGPDGPVNGTCSEHCHQFHPTEGAAQRQLRLVNEWIQCDLSPVFKLTLLRLVAIVGFYQSRGTTTFQTSAKRIGESIGLSAQSVRTVLHALARHDRDELHNEHGLIDLDSTRVPEAGPFCSVFDITPLTAGGYAGFLEAVVAYAPELPVPMKRAPRQKQEEVRPPPEVVQIPNCPGSGKDHPMRSRPVRCASCEDDLIEEVRYTQNATPYRSEATPPLWDVSGDTPQHSEPAGLPTYWPVYDRVPS